jgi:hypothetical protein
MALPMLTAVDALAAAREPLCYLLRIVQSEAASFSGPGWTRLEPPRDGSVLFIHRERELLAVRARGVL